ncbi:MAG: hypothetical protein WCD49_00455 [Candidatus Acidiferrales bacterium]
MASKLRAAFRETQFFHLYKSISAWGEYASWKLRNVPGAGAPHLVKQRTIAEFASRFNLQTLVETGTNYGHMLYVNQKRFREIYSIELDEHRAQSAQRKFASHSNIHVLQGDSAKVLPKLLLTLKETCLFWLDGHDFDISTPVKEELDAIYAHPIRDHVLLIDDARWFDGRTQYPTLEQLREKTARAYPSHTVEVRDDIIRIYGS